MGLCLLFDLDSILVQVPASKLDFKGHSSVVKHHWGRMEASLGQESGLINPRKTTGIPELELHAGSKDGSLGRILMHEMVSSYTNLLMDLSLDTS